MGPTDRVDFLFGTTVLIISVCILRLFYSMAHLQRTCSHFWTNRVFPFVMAVRRTLCLLCVWSPRRASQQSRWTTRQDNSRTTKTIAMATMGVQTTTTTSTQTTKIETVSTGGRQIRTMRSSRCSSRYKHQGHRQYQHQQRHRHRRQLQRRPAWSCSVSSLLLVLLCSCLWVPASGRISASLSTELTHLRDTYSDADRDRIENDSNSHNEARGSLLKATRPPIASVGCRHGGDDCDGAYMTRWKRCHRVCDGRHRRRRTIHQHCGGCFLYPSVCVHIYICLCACVYR